MTERSEALGKDGNRRWDDKSDHDDVTKIYVNYSLMGIESIRFDYVKSGKPIEGPFRGETYNTYTHTFEINHLKNEHLESVEGSYTQRGIQTLQFKTNLRISEPIGYPGKDGIKFILAVEGKKIIGFHGSTYFRLYSLGAYFTRVTPTRIEAIGGKVGTKWDDGVDQAGFTKIHVRSGQEGIQFIKFEYVDKNGRLRDGSIHGSIYRRGSPHVFEIRHVDKEYLVSVEGYYDGDGDCAVIQALRFRTNVKTSQLMGPKTGKKFRLAASGMKIVGFHGYAEKNLTSLGGYFTPIIPTKSECQGVTERSTLWDSGAFEGIRKVSVTWRSYCIRCFRINYENDGKVVKRAHGMNDDSRITDEFVVDYPYEVITSIVGTMNDSYVTSFVFKTSKGRTSRIFGERTSDSVEFVIESKGCAVVGFHGWYAPLGAGYITALGAHFYPMPLPPAAEKLEAKGGAGGVPWDDGSNFERVRKIYIGTCEVGIVSVRFLYENDIEEIVVGDHHGNKKLLRHEEFDLDNACEYLTSVEGSYDVIPGSEDVEVILMLKFTTNKRTSPCYGLDDDPTFVLHKAGHRIIGFHGKSSNMLHKLGIHVLPITDP